MVLGEKHGTNYLPCTNVEDFSEQYSEEYYHKTR